MAGRVGGWRSAAAGPAARHAAGAPRHDAASTEAAAYNVQLLVLLLRGPAAAIGLAGCLRSRLL